MEQVPLLALAGVGKVFGTGDVGVRALDTVDLTISAGEYVAIIGPSGSGKSTLMTVLGCLDRPTHGSYHIAGQDVSALSSDALAALRRDTFGFVFQRYHLLSDATALENVEIPAIYAGLDRDARCQRGQDLLQRLGLAERAHHRPGQLSGGQQQRVSIARALVNDPPVILADEPTGALDRQSGIDLLALLDDLHAEGRTILVVTHDPKVAARAQRVIEIQDGRIVADTRVADRPMSPQKPPLHPVHRPSGAESWLGNLTEAGKMALRSLHANPFRTALTLLGVVIGVASVVAMLAIGSGSKRQVMERIQAMGTNLLLVRPGAPGTHRGDVLTLKASDADALISLPDVAQVVPERQGSFTLRFGNIDHKAEVRGTGADFAVARDWALDDGIFFDAEDVRSYATVVVLGKTVARHLFADQRPVGQYVMIRHVPFLVVGVLEAKGATTYGTDMDDMVVVPLTTGLSRLFGRDHLSAIMVRVGDVAAIRDVQKAVHGELLSRHGGIEDFQIRNTAAILKAAEGTQNSLTVLLGAVALISLVVGGIGVMNIMLVSVSERTGEIGIRMATGARMRDILLQFNTEAVVVCGLGGAIGVSLGVSAALGCRWAGMPVVISPWPSALAFVCAFFTGLVFGFLPARKAACLDPVVALATE